MILESQTPYTPQRPYKHPTSDNFPWSLNFFRPHAFLLKIYAKISLPSGHRLWLWLGENIYSGLSSLKGCPIHTERQREIEEEKFSLCMLYVFKQWERLNGDAEEHLSVDSVVWEMKYEVQLNMLLFLAVFTVCSF